uniref:Uncharacterized protein n=1 Tax=Ditylenchus dipsaci TaxID=166011 RepID=A0A915D1M9_9BILA
MHQQCHPRQYDSLGFLIEGEGGKIGVLPLQARGRRLRGDLNVLCAHTDPVSDFCFFKFLPILATCASSEKLKICLAMHLMRLKKQLLLETRWGLIAVGSGTNGYAVDVCAEKIVIELDDVPDRAQSVDWSENGGTLVISGTRADRLHCLTQEHLLALFRR